MGRFFKGDDPEQRYWKIRILLEVTRLMVWILVTVADQHITQLL